MHLLAVCTWEAVHNGVVPHLNKLVKKQQNCRQEGAQACVFCFEILNRSTVVSLQQNAPPDATCVVFQKHMAY